jgi:hypothetical protein
LSAAHRFQQERFVFFSDAVLKGIQCPREPRNRPDA